ncbi:hypothetical protein F5Y15DRAFT_250153 [Xylariaceae sp. FL0016]|nr:hypothetical protein F5Y15DRAFT_250153 [Xylariaceae sp. FL0016]
MDKSNLTRIRDNQRRSRARRKEYVQDLEKRLRLFESKGVEASFAIQQAARKVNEENRRLRALLSRAGLNEQGVNALLQNDNMEPTESIYTQSLSITEAANVPFVRHRSLPDSEYHTPKFPIDHRRSSSDTTTSDFMPSAQSGHQCFTIRPELGSLDYKGTNYTEYPSSEPTSPCSSETLDSQSQLGSVAASQPPPVPIYQAQFPSGNNYEGLLLRSTHDEVAIAPGVSTGYEELKSVSAQQSVVALGESAALCGIVATGAPPMVDPWIPGSNFVGYSPGDGFGALSVGDHLHPHS